MGTIYFSDEFYQIARNAYERSKNDPTEAIVAIIFSAITIEVFLNEMVDFATNQHLPKNEPEEISAFASILSNLENQKAQLDLKIQVLHYIFKKSQLNRGELPYQDFDLLIKIRNALVHKKPEKWTWSLEEGDNNKFEPHKYIKRLADRKIIPAPTSNEPPHWQALISRPEVARWACNVASQMIEFLADLVPVSQYKQLQESWIKGFVKIEE